MSKEPLYRIEKIVASKQSRGLELFRVRWEGYPPSADTWEPLCNVASTGHADQFFLSQREKVLKRSPGTPGSALIEYDDGEQCWVDLTKEKFARAGTGTKSEKDENDYNLIYVGAKIDLLWPHLDDYFPVQVVEWNPLEKSGRSRHVSSAAGDTGANAKNQCDIKARTADVGILGNRSTSKMFDQLVSAQKPHHDTNIQDDDSSQVSSFSEEGGAILSDDDMYSLGVCDTACSASGEKQSQPLTRSRKACLLDGDLSNDNQLTRQNKKRSVDCTAPPKSEDVRLNEEAAVSSEQPTRLTRKCSDAGLNEDDSIPHKSEVVRLNEEGNVSSDQLTHQTRKCSVDRTVLSKTKNAGLNEDGSISSNPKNDSLNEEGNVLSDKPFTRDRERSADSTDGPKQKNVSFEEDNVSSKPENDSLSKEGNVSSDKPFTRSRKSPADCAVPPKQKNVSMNEAGNISSDRPFTRSRKRHANVHLNEGANGSSSYDQPFTRSRKRHADCTIPSKQTNVNLNERANGSSSFDKPFTRSRKRHANCTVPSKQTNVKLNEDANGSKSCDKPFTRSRKRHTDCTVLSKPKNVSLSKEKNEKAKESKKTAKRPKKQANVVSEFKVESIVDSKRNLEGLTLYRVRWEGFEESDDTWEPIENVAHTGHVDRYLREKRAETISADSPGAAIIEYDDGERALVDLRQETFRRFMANTTGGSNDESLNDFKIVYPGSKLELFWLHVDLFFTCRVISWTPLQNEELDSTYSTSSNSPKKKSGKKKNQNNHTFERQSSMDTKTAAACILQTFKTPTTRNNVSRNDDSVLASNEMEAAEAEMVSENEKTSSSVSEDDESLLKGRRRESITAAEILGNLRQLENSSI